MPKLMVKTVSVPLLFMETKGEEEIKLASYFLQPIQVCFQINCQAGSTNNLEEFVIVEI